MPILIKTKVKTIFVLLLVSSVRCDMEQLRAIDPNYGITWMFLPDDQGVPHIVDLTKPEDTSQERSGNSCNEDVTFYFHRQLTREDPTAFKFINDSTIPLSLPSSYDENLPIIFLIHGWRNSINSSFSQQIKNAYLEREDINVFVVDWSPLADDTLYFRSASATEDVGHHVGEFIDRLVTESETTLESVHIIGHSLGAHASGFAGSSIQSGKVARVTGLDPALPGFTDMQPENMLDPSDGNFVDVIHTCAGTVGHPKSLGHADFYPNGGHAIQPGCQAPSDFTCSCSHGKAYEYYADSVTDPDAFMAYPCENYIKYKKNECTTGAIPMGEGTPSDARGTHYLKTTD